MEIQIAGSEEERNILMPLAYVTEETPREKAELNS
jgi:hypothetical protein